MNMLVGKSVVISGLKKKLICVGKKSSYQMLLTTETTAVSLYRLQTRSIVEDGGVYSGIVTAVYMNGMVVELDGKVWLVVTDLKIDSSHTVRAGSVVSPCYCTLPSHYYLTCFILNSESTFSLEDSI